MKYLMITILTSALMTTGVGFTSQAMAKQAGHHGGGYGQHHDGSHWKATLSDEQRTKLDQLKLDYKKKKYPIKAKLKVAKVELALLMTSDSPSQSDIDKKIESILKLKSEKMRLKAAHKIGVRKILTAEQRVKFDMHVLAKAFKGKHHRRHH